MNLTSSHKCNKNVWFLLEGNKLINLIHCTSNSIAKKLEMGQLFTFRFIKSSCQNYEQLSMFKVIVSLLLKLSPCILSSQDCSGSFSLT